MFSEDSWEAALPGIYRPGKEGQCPIYQELFRHKGQVALLTAFTARPPWVVCPRECLATSPLPPPGTEEAWAREDPTSEPC